MAEKKGGEGGQRVVYSSPYSALFAARFEGARVEWIFLDAYLPSYDDFRRFEPRCPPLQPISGPCSIEKYVSSRMAKRYTRIFDAG